MRKNELIEKIKNVSEMVFSINGKRFTVCDEDEKGISIAKWNHQESEQYFPDAESLVNGYQIDGKTVAEQAEIIKIEDYTGFNE